MSPNISGHYKLFKSIIWKTFHKSYMIQLLYHFLADNNLNQQQIYCPFCLCFGSSVESASNCCPPTSFKLVIISIRTWSPETVLFSSRHILWIRVREARMSFPTFFSPCLLFWIGVRFGLARLSFSLLFLPCLIFRIRLTRQPFPTSFSPCLLFWTGVRLRLVRQPLQNLFLSHLIFRIRLAMARLSFPTFFTPCLLFWTGIRGPARLSFLFLFSRFLLFWTGIRLGLALPTLFPLGLLFWTGIGLMRLTLFSCCNTIWILKFIVFCLQQNIRIRWSKVIFSQMSNQIKYSNKKTL